MMIQAFQWAVLLSATTALGFDGLRSGSRVPQEPAAGKPAASPNVLNLAAGAKSPAATIEQLAWITGHWEGEAMDGRFEETWNAPSAGTMVGMFKFTQDSEVKLRIKHFRADMVGWEEKDRSVEFPLVKISENEAYFSGLTYRKVGPDEIHIFVLIGDDRQGKEVKFVCRRVPAKR
jgi:hypothetical protein